MSTEQVLMLDVSWSVHCRGAGAPMALVQNDDLQAALARVMLLRSSVRLWSKKHPRS